MPAATIFSGISADSVCGPIVQMILALRVDFHFGRRQAKEKIANPPGKNYGSATTQGGLCER
jgi:hypothetical protein